MIWPTGLRHRAETYLDELDIVVSSIRVHFVSRSAGTHDAILK
jgi:hypothetical protein